MAEMRFVKMHGARNDFVLYDARQTAIDDAGEVARRVCDRRTGIGADGLLVVLPSRIADIAMRIFNADGSEAEMCGNGIRCLARFLDEAGAGARLAVETPAGIVETRVVQREPEYLVRVRIARPRERALETPKDAHFVDVGNPHVVLFRSDDGELDLVDTALALQGSEALPNGGNVHVATVEDDGLRVRHWERGVGLTQACGTGAVACAAAAIARGVASSPVRVRVPGGTLVVEWDGSGDASLTGPAARVFETTLDPWAP